MGSEMCIRDRLIKCGLHLATAAFLENLIKVVDDVFATTELDFVTTLTRAQMIGVDIHLLNSTTEIDM